jgi:hypothetical protein
MAVIRIVNLPENSQSLIDELRARGFVVRTGAHDNSESADLEVSVEECSVQEALERCTNSGEPATVFIAPGAVEETWRPIATVPLIPEIPEVEEAVEPESMIAPQSALANQQMLAQAAVELHQGSKEPYFAESSGAPQVRGVLQEAANAFSETAKSDMVSPVEAVVSEPVIASSEDQSAEIINGEPVPVAPLPVEQPAVLQSSSESVSSEITEAEAVSPSSDLPSDWPIWNPLSEPVFAADEAGAESVAAEVPIRSTRSTVPSNKWELDERIFWKAAPVAAAVALFVLLAMTAYHRTSPLPRTLSQGRGEQQNQQVPLARSRSDRDAHLKKVSAEAALVPQRLDARQQSRQGPTAPPPGVSNASKLDRIGPSRSTTARNDGEFVARDTVVRYPGKRSDPETTRKPAENGKRSGIKRYSDLPTAAR